MERATERGLNCKTQEPVKEGCSVKAVWMVGVQNLRNSRKEPSIVLGNPEIFNPHTKLSWES